MLCTDISKKPLLIRYNMEIKILICSPFRKILIQRNFNYKSQHTSYRNNAVQAIFKQTNKQAQLRKKVEVFMQITHVSQHTNSSKNMRDNEAVAIRYSLYQSPFLAGHRYHNDTKKWLLSKWRWQSDLLIEYKLDSLPVFTDWAGLSE